MMAFLNSTSSSLAQQDPEMAEVEAERGKA